MLKKLSVSNLILDIVTIKIFLKMSYYLVKNIYAMIVILETHFLVEFVIKK
jgi:hypothetical protein